jgi:hypothetical protein
MDKDILRGAVLMAIKLQDHYQGEAVQPEKYMTFQVIELSNSFKVEFNWLYRINKHGEGRYMNEHFIVEKPFDLVKINEDVETMLVGIKACDIDDRSVRLDG